MLLKFPTAKLFSRYVTVVYSIGAEYESHFPSLIFVTCDFHVEYFCHFVDLGSFFFIYINEFCFYLYFY